MTLAPGADAACTERDPRVVADAWAALSLSRARPSIFLTPEWIAVARAHDPATAITLAIGDPPSGIAALVQDTDGTIRFAGGELTDEQDVVATAGREREAALALGSWLRASAAPRIDLSFVYEDLPTLDAIAAQLEGAYAMERTRLVTAPFISLPVDYESWVQGLEKKERHELRRKVRRIETAGDARFRNTSDGERGVVLDRFFELHRLSRGEKASFMTDDRERFFRDVADALAPSGRLRLGVLSYDGQDAAVLFGFAYGKTLALYNAAYDPGLASLSVGVVSHAWAVRAAIAEGFTVYDLLRGDEPYKYDLGAVDRYLGRLLAVRR